MNDMGETGSGPTPAVRERPTLKTIAFMTGLGVTTVSRALKDAPDIGAETKERVRMVARQLGYQPNRAGVRLRTGKTNVIALVLSIDEDLFGFTSHLVYGVTEVLTGTPYHLVVTPHSLNRDPMVPIHYILDTGSADGVIISRTEPNDPRVALLTESNMPFATHGRTQMDIEHPFHDYDNEAFAYEAIRRLVARGRRRIALLQPPRSLSYYHHTRDGFLRGLRDFGAEEVPFFDVSNDDPLDQLRDACEALMRGPDAPDGFVSSSAGSTIGLMAGIEAAGKHLGTDIDLVSKQSAALMQWIRPEIMVADEDFRQAGRDLARGVLARIRGEDPKKLQFLSTPVFED